MGSERDAMLTLDIALAQDEGVKEEDACIVDVLGENREGLGHSEDFLVPAAVCHDGKIGGASA